MFRFRKIFTCGPFRATWTGKRLGWSFGVPGCRLGFGADGGIYLTFGIPGTGMSYTKKKSAERTKNHESVWKGAVTEERNGNKDCHAHP